MVICSQIVSLKYCRTAFICLTHDRSDETSFTVNSKALIIVSGSDSGIPTTGAGPGVVCGLSQGY